MKKKMTAAVLLLVCFFCMFAVFGENTHASMLAPPAFSMEHASSSDMGPVGILLQDSAAPSSGGKQTNGSIFAVSVVAAVAITVLIGDVIWIFIRDRFKK